MAEIKVGCWNTHGLRFKLEAVNNLMNECDLEFLFCCETWATREMLPHARCVLGDALPKQGPFGHHYGVALFSRKEESQYEIRHVDYNSIVWTCEGLQFTGEYIPPYNNAEEEFDHIARLTAHVAITNLPTVFLGDFNMRFGALSRDESTNTRANTVGRWLRNEGFCFHTPLQSEPRFTFSSTRGASIVDYIIVAPGIVVHEYHHVATTNVSDHIPVTATVESSGFQPLPEENAHTRPQWRTRRLENEKYTATYLLRFREYARDLEKYFKNLRNGLPVQMVADLFDEALLWAVTAAADEVLGRKAPTTRGCTLVKNPQLKKLERMCTVTAKRIQCSRNAGLRIHLEQGLRALIQQRNLYVQQAKKVVKLQTVNFNKRLNRNPHQLLAKKLKHLKKASSRRPLMAVDLNDYVEHLKAHFRTASPPPEFIPEDEHPAIRLANPQQSDTITPKSVSRAIQDLLSDRAPGPSGLPIDLIKPLRFEISTILSRFFSFLLAKGVIPQSWTKAFVYPVPKISNASQPKHYRPIVLTEVFRKIYERTLKDPLTKVIEPLSPEQCGFRERRSTLHQVATINEDMRQFRSIFGYDSVVAFLDVAKAYDCVDLGKLWPILRRRGVSEGLIRTLQRLQVECELQIAYGGRLSRPFSRDAGLLQGSCLSPLLYSVYIDDIVQRMRGEANVMLYLFADDIAVITPDKETLRGALRRAETFAYERGFRFSPTKCAILQNERDSSEVLLHGQPIPEVEQFKYLGVIITASGVDWLAHFKRNSEKQRGMLQRFVALGFRPGGFLPRTAQMVLKCFLRPVGEYGLAITPGKEAFLKPLQNVQNETLRYMLGGGPRTSVAALHLLADIPMIRSRHDTLKSCFLAEVQRQPQDSRVLKAFHQSQIKLVRDSCFSDIAGLDMYKHYAHWCQHTPVRQWHQVLALWKHQAHREQRTRLRSQCPRGAAFSETNLFTDLSRCSPAAARLIHRWVLGQLPAYPSGCTVCGQLSTPEHVINCLKINPDRMIRMGYYELACFSLQAIERQVIAL